MYACRAMGTWGEGNLDSDFASEEMDERVSEIVRALLERAKTKESRQTGEDDHIALFVDFEILFALDAADLVSEFRLPPPDEVEHLKEAWLADWQAYRDRYFPEEGAADFTAKRRKVIEATFDRFIGMCRRQEHMPTLVAAEPTPTGDRVREVWSQDARADALQKLRRKMFGEDEE